MQEEFIRKSVAFTKTCLPKCCQLLCFDSDIQQINFLASYMNIQPMPWAYSDVPNRRACSLSTQLCTKQACLSIRNFRVSWVGKPTDLPFPMSLAFTGATRCCVPHLHPLSYNISAVGAAHSHKNVSVWVQQHFAV